MEENKSWLLNSVLGLIVLGVLANAFFVGLFVPASGWLVNSFLTLFTFGASAAKNFAYGRIAAGPNEFAASLNLFVLVLAIFFGSMVVYSGSLILFNISEREFEELKMTTKQRNEAKASRLKRRVSRTRILRKLVWIFASCSFLVVSFLVVHSLMLVYGDSAVAHYRQSLAICRPYLEPGEADMIESRFALIRSKEDYVAVLARLGEVARANGVELPEFEPW